MDRNRQRRLRSWLAIGALLLFCGILGLLQYRWIGEVTISERERLRASLHSSLIRLSTDFNSEITADCRALIPSGGEPDNDTVEDEIASRYSQWKKVSRHPVLFENVAIVELTRTATVLRRLDFQSGEFRTIPWPEAWKPILRRLELRRAGGPHEEGPPGPPPELQGPRLDDMFAPGVPFVAPLPRRSMPRDHGREPVLLLFELNQPYVTDVLLPEVLQRHLGSGGILEYQAVVMTRTEPASLVYESEPRAKLLLKNADGTVYLFEFQYDQMFRRTGGGFALRGPGPGRGIGGPGPGWGRWQLSVRHRAGSLEALVETARARNLAVTGGVLLLMLATIAALVRFTRQSQKLAELQMDFVAGVSHELRTPLTVIHTAAYNLRGTVAANPAQVERYGALIQQESGRLKDLVEQVLRFASTQAGKVVQNFEPVDIATVVTDALEASKAMVQGARCTVEKNIEAELPPVNGDRGALKQAVQNLIENAAKYGAEGGQWIGVSAARKPASNGPGLIEITVADRGPGIPGEEQKHVFEPFFRGRRAVQNQIRGTGLGLNLVKKIVEAHGGTIHVSSESMKGSTFVVRLPIASLGGVQ